MQKICQNEINMTNYKILFTGIWFDKINKIRFTLNGGQ